MNDPVIPADVRRCRPDLVRSFQAILQGEEREPPSVTVSPTRSGDLTMYLDRVLVYSSVAPRRTAVRAVKQILKSGPDAIVVFGTGLGYHLEALRQDAAEVPVFLIEPSPTLLALALRHTTGDWWCKNGPEYLVPALPGQGIAESGIIETLRDLNVYRPEVLLLPGFNQRYECRITDLRAALDSYRRRRKVNRDTLRRFGTLWVRNTIKNIPVSATIPGIEHWENSAADVPALVCGAGPTLDSILPHLPELRRRCLVIAVDTAVAALQREKAPPHIAVVTDPQYWNSRHLDPVRSTIGLEHPAVLVAEPATHPRVFRLWRGPGIVSASLFPLGSFIDRRRGRSKRLGAGGSVATSAWDLARFMGCKRIYMAGVDLGFPFMRTHCSGSFFEERILRNAGRLTPAEQSLFRYLHDANPRPVADAAGATVLSDERMEVYRSWFAEQQKIHPEIETVLLSPHSSAIDGTTTADPEDVVHAMAPYSGSPIRQPEPGTQRAGDRADAVLPGTDEIHRDLEARLDEIASLAHQGLTLCERFMEQATVSGDDLARFDEIDRRLASHEERELAGFLSTDGLERATAMNVETPRDAVLQARGLYEALAESCRYHRELLYRYR